MPASPTWSSARMSNWPGALHMAFSTNLRGKSKALARPRIAPGFATHPSTTTRLPSKNSPTANLPAIDLLSSNATRKSLESPLTSSSRYPCTSKLRVSQSAAAIKLSIT